MSFNVSAACMRLKMPGVAKSVLMQLAEISNDAGFAWPSIEHLCMRTCWGRSAVIEAINYLVDKQVLTRDKTSGRNTKYWIKPADWAGEFFTDVNTKPSANQSAKRTGLDADPSASQTSPPNGPVRQTDLTRPAGGLDPSAKRTLTIKNSQEQEKEEKSACAPTTPNLIQPDDVDGQTWTDWLQLRKTKRAPVNQTVIAGARREAGKAGLSLSEFLGVWCTRGSQGLSAAWLSSNERSGAGLSDENQPVESFRERDARAVRARADEFMGRSNRPSHCATTAFVIDVTPSQTNHLGEST